MFNFNINEPRDLAFSHGHSAYRLLAIAQEIEDEYRRNQDQLKKLPYGRMEYLEIAARNKFLTDDMLRVSSASVMVFQAMMEATINDVISPKGALPSLAMVGGFKNKWCKALNLVNQPTDSFLKYETTVYQHFRNPMVHSIRERFGNLNDLTFISLYSGYWHGWEAFRQLYEGIGQPHDPDSWSTMCKTHDLPTKLPSR